MTDDIGYIFKDKSLFAKAMTHTSAAKSPNDSNERLEFIGDRVLNMIVAELLYDLYPKEREGHLARRLTNLVCAPALQEVANEIQLAAHLRLSAGEAGSGGHQKMNVLADACEALVAAIYLDGGLDAARTFIHAHWTDRAKADRKPVQDAKSALQEWAQGKGLPLPVYDVIERTGPDHAPHFVISVCVQGFDKTTGEGITKREAEKAAAEKLLESVQS